MAGNRVPPMPPIAHGEPDDEWGDPADSFDRAQPVAGADQLADAFAGRESLDRSLAAKQRSARQRELTREELAKAYGIPLRYVRGRRRWWPWRGSRVNWADYLAGSGLTAGGIALTHPADALVATGASLMFAAAVLIEVRGRSRSGS